MTSARTNSGHGMHAMAGFVGRRWWHAWSWFKVFSVGALCAWLCLSLARPALATPGETNATVECYRSAKAAFEAQPQNAETAWQFGRACFDLGLAATNKAERAAFAEEGIAACRKGLAAASNSAPLHYYLGLNIGQLAETRGFSALKLVNQLEAELIKAAALDSKFDNAGADRTLGMLYRDAPSIVSVGNRGKARKHLLRAVELAPLFPENRIELIQSLVKWNDREDARSQLQALVDIWATARAKFSGPEWAENWSAWDTALDGLKKKLGVSAKLETPRH